MDDHRWVITVELKDEGVPAKTASSKRGALCPPHRHDDNNDCPLSHEARSLASFLCAPCPSHSLRVQHRRRERCFGRCCRERATSRRPARRASANQSCRRRFFVTCSVSITPTAYPLWLVATASGRMRGSGSSACLEFRFRSLPGASRRAIAPCGPDMERSEKGKKVRRSVVSFRRLHALGRNAAAF